MKREDFICEASSKIAVAHVSMDILSDSEIVEAAVSLASALASKLEEEGVVAWPKLDRPK